MRLKLFLSLFVSSVASEKFNTIRLAVKGKHPLQRVVAVVGDYSYDDNEQGFVSEQLNTLVIRASLKYEDCWELDLDGLVLLISTSEEKSSVYIAMDDELNEDASIQAEFLNNVSESDEEGPLSEHPNIAEEEVPSTKLQECKELGSHIISSDGSECISCKYGLKPGPNYSQCVPVCDETMCPEPNKKCIVHNGEAKCTCHDGYDFVEESNKCLCIVGYNENLERTPRVKGRVCQRCLPGQKLIKTNKNVYCKDEQSECEPSDDKRNRLPNINIIGKGYNVPISNPFNKKTDRGFEPDASIFSPFSIRDYDDVCRIRGYNRPDMGRTCSGNIKTMVFFNAEQVKETIQQKIAKENNYKEVTLDVSEAENSQFTNSLAFGESVSLTAGSNKCKTNSHCVDRGLAENTEVGQSMENNGQTSNSRTKSNTKSNTVEASVKASVTAEAGFPGFGSVSATAEVSEGVSHTNGETNEKTSSSSNGWSQGSSSSHGQSSSINTNMCDNQEKCETENREDSQNVNNENSNSKANEYSISYRVPGFEEALTDSSDVVKAKEYLSKTSGSIAVSNIDCVRYEIALDLHSPPAFSNQFKDRVEKMNQVSIDLAPYRFIVTKIGHEDDDFNTLVNKTTEAKFDSEFSTFIRQFGTHFFKEVTMGAMLTYKTNIKKVETQQGGQDDLENCIEQMHQKKIQEKSTGKESKHYCTNKLFEKEIESSLETEDHTFSSIGGPLGSIADPSRWSEHDFNDPKIIDFKVIPIVTILNPLVMTSERISNQFGKDIHIRKIYSWFMPRYSHIINRCKSLSNHRLSDMGDGCEECSAGTVPTQDGMTCISIFTKCQALANHKVSNDRKRCEECSDGMVPTQNRTTCISIFTKCKDLANHIVSNDRKRCEECSDGMVPTQVGMTCISIFTKCEALANHKVSNDRKRCEECSDGLVSAQGGMTCISIFTKCKSLVNYRLSNDMKRCEQCPSNLVSTKNQVYCKCPSEKMIPKGETRCVSTKNHCRTLKNHRMSLDKSGCEPCSDGMVPTKDLLGCMLYDYSDVIYDYAPYKTKSLSSSVPTDYYSDLIYDY